jgi:hypothetical protein
MRLEASQEDRLAAAREALEAVEKRKLGRPTINPGRRLTRAEKQARYFEKYPDRKHQSLERIRKLKGGKE